MKLSIYNIQYKKNWKFGICPIALENIQTLHRKEDIHRKKGEAKTMCIKGQTAQKMQHRYKKHPIMYVQAEKM